MDELYEGVDDFFAPERKRAAEEQKTARLELVSDMQSVLSTPAGRRIIYWMIERGAPLRDDYNGRALDLAYASGQKRISSEVMDLALRADPYIFQKFIESKLIKKENEDG